MNPNAELPEDLISRDTEHLVCKLGQQSGLSWRFDECGRERDLTPIRIGGVRRPGPYPEGFYRAQKWLRRKRLDLQRCIIEQLDYGSKREQYGRGREVLLVTDLATAIAPICHKPHPVDPLLVATLLVKIGLDNFCEGYDQDQTNLELWSLERALGLDSNEANNLAWKGNKLLIAGNWKDAVQLLERALTLCPLHFDALNDLTYIYGTNYPKCEQGLEYARQLFHRTIESEPAVLDTIGWAGFRHGGNIDTVEVCLREALKGLKPGESFYITVAYHLMAVLIAREKNGEAYSLFEQFVHFPATNAIDEESLTSAKQLMQQ
jgi:tetratricopeptide (TPR) repeat protein